MLPNFLILGVQKGATTWLAKCLGEHPDVFIPEVKETHFFSRYFEKGVAWYEAQYFSKWSGQTAVGEATPGYVYYRDVAGRVKETLGGKVKLIVSLRHPIDRAYSAFWMHLSRGTVPVDADFRIYFDQNQYELRSRGYYFAQLSHYLEYFPRENLLILIYEEMKAGGQRAVGNCFEFLGVDPQLIPGTLGAKVNKGIAVSVFHYQIWGLRRAMKLLPRGIEKPLASVGRRIFERVPKRKGYGSLAEDLRQELLGEFMPDIKQLEDFLGRDLSIWYTRSSA